MTSEYPQKRQRDTVTDTAKLVAQYIGVAIAIGTLVWGAAKISSSSEEMKIAITNLNVIVASTRESNISLMVEQARQQVQLDVLRRQLEDMERK